jgi:hypothetical protein
VKYRGRKLTQLCAFTSQCFVLRGNLIFRKSLLPFAAGLEQMRHHDISVEWSSDEVAAFVYLRPKANTFCSLILF